MKRTPMKRSCFRRPESRLGPGKPPSRRRKRKLIKGHHESKYLAVCKGQSCFLSIPEVCGGVWEDDTVVPCHSNQGQHGKGMGIKAKDIYTVPGCMYCHGWIDQGHASKADKFAAWDDAYARWRKVRAVLMGGDDD